MAARFRHDFYEDELLYLDYIEREPEGLIIERGNPFEDLDDYKFFERFRLTKETVSYLEILCNGFFYNCDWICNENAQNNRRENYSRSK